MTYEGHIHHSSAREWFDGLEVETRLCFCRFTQISLLRLLTTSAIMGKDEVLTHAQAWEAYDRWLQDSRVVFLEEPTGLEPSFRSLSQQRRPSPKTWADSYLAAFSTIAGMRLVTFDRALQLAVKDALLLKS